MSKNAAKHVANGENIYVCKGKGQSVCMKEFLDTHPELEYVRVDSDGNCFFRSLAAYYTRTGEQAHGVDDPTNFHELRAYIVQQFGQLMRKDAVLQNVLPAINDRPIDTILSELSRTCVWNVPVFEMMVERVSDILRINLTIYRVNTNENVYSVSWRTYTPRQGPAASHISVFLASNHYGLLFPRQRSSATASVAAVLAAHYSRKTKKNKKQVNNNTNLNAAIAASLQHMKLENVNEPGSRKTKKNNKRVKNNTNLNAAIAASLQHIKLKNVNEPGAPNTLKKKNNKHTVAASVAASAAASSNASASISIELIQELIPYKITIPEIKKKLDMLHISYSPKDKKEVLYTTLVSAILEGGMPALERIV